MSRRLARAAFLMLIVPLALPCGPFFNDAHHGLDHDPTEGSLERFYCRLLRDGADLDQRVAEAAALCARARTEEADGRWRDARGTWAAALPGVCLDARAVHQWRPRGLRDRLDLLPLVGSRLSEDEWRSYAAAATEPALGPWDTRPKAVAGAGLLALATSANDEFAAAALTTLGWREALAGSLDEARAHLGQALARAPTGAKADEDGYLLAVLPVFGHLGEDGRVDDPAAALAAIERWAEAHPASPWRAAARSWQACILYHHRQLAWGDTDGLLAATRIWQRLLLEPGGDEVFIPCVESLRFAYRRLRPRPPPWMIADPRHAAAYAWHAITDRVDRPDRDALLAAVEPSLARLPATRPEPEVLISLAEIWLANGRPAAALPLARNALAARPTPEARYLVARLAAVCGEPAEAERAARELTVDDPRRYDLLVRIGSAWEERREWARALSCYARAGSEMDVAILAEGEMPIDDLAACLAGDEPLVATTADPWNRLGDGKPQRDFRPELRARLGRRLVRAGRETEALAWLDGDLRGLCAGLIALEDELRAAAPAERARCLWALASYWYDEGRRLVFTDRHWHQWAWYHLHAAEAVPSARLDEARAAYDGEMLALSVYERALPLFLEIADRFPTDAHAPDALYHAALCRYWPCGQTYMKDSPWWLERAKSEGFWKLGDALLRRLAHDYPDHALARDAKVLRALGAAP